MTLADGNIVVKAVSVGNGQALADGIYVKDNAVIEIGDGKVDVQAKGSGKVGAYGLYSIKDANAIAGKVTVGMCDISVATR